MSHTDAFSVRATVLKINTGIYQIHRYHFGDVTKALSELGTFSSEIEAQRAFYKTFPNGALAEENRRGIMSMPNREIARNYTRLRNGWSVKDNGKEAGMMRWACVKAHVPSEPKESKPVAEFLTADERQLFDVRVGMGGRLVECNRPAPYEWRAGTYRKSPVFHQLIKDADSLDDNTMYEFAKSFY